MIDKNQNISPDSWDEEYSSGRWSYLGDFEQVPRYALLAAWCEKLKSGASVLDIGCGEGILLNWLRSYKYYEGVDFSKVAIERAKKTHKHSDIQSFHYSSAESFCEVCRKRFDLIVFNEILYYCVNPIELMRHCESLLETGGYFIVSITGIKPITWNKIETVYSDRFAAHVQIEEMQTMKFWNLAAISVRK